MNDTIMPAVITNNNSKVTKSLFDFMPDFSKVERSESQIKELLYHNFNKLITDEFTIEDAKSYLVQELGKLSIFEENEFIVISSLVDTIIDEILTTSKFNSWDNQEVLNKELKFEEIFVTDSINLLDFYKVKTIEMTKSLLSFKGTYADIDYLIKSSNSKVIIQDKFDDDSIPECALATTSVADLDDNFTGLDLNIIDNIRSLLESRISLCAVLDYVNYRILAHDLFDINRLSDTIQVKSSNISYDEVIPTYNYDTNWNFDGLLPYFDGIRSYDDILQVSTNNTLYELISDLQLHKDVLAIKITNNINVVWDSVIKFVLYLYRILILLSIQYLIMMKVYILQYILHI